MSAINASGHNRQNGLFLATTIALISFASSLAAQDNNGVQTAIGQGNTVSPALRIERTPDDNAPALSPRPPSGVRSYDGSGNNVAMLTLGQAKQPLRRICPAEYTDHISSMAGATRPSPRAISNAINAQSVAHANSQHLSDMFWQWGQFLDHDMDLSGGMDPPESAPIAVPMGDPEFDPQSTGTQTIALNRSIYLPSSGTGIANPRQQLNELSNWIDGSQVYGSSEERALALRTLDGTGRLRSSDNGMLLPLALNGDPAPGAAYEFFAGDARVDEQVGLTSMHTLFMREHNHQVARLHQRHPNWSDEQLYQGARAIVGAEIEKITYDEFLPLLIGKHALPR
ncbi:MAG: peroxidase family protein, partial [Dokdonella sp.]